MKKNLKKILLSVTLVSVLTLFSGCYGSFEITKSIYKWNGNVTNDQFANSVVTWALIIIPVYEVSMFLDFVVLNTIEFWTGDNPLGMNEGEFDNKTIESNGNTYEITATKNKFHIEKLNSFEKNEIVELYFDETNGSWNYSDGINSYTLAQGDVENNEWIKLFYPNGKTETIALK